jgi:hypothetical protein
MRDPDSYLIEVGQYTQIASTGSTTTVNSASDTIV